MMAKNPKNQIGRLVYFREEVDTLFRSLFMQKEPPALAKGELLPPVDILEGKEEILIRVELPGISPEKIEVSFSSGVIFISGIKKEKFKEGRVNYLCIERSFGKFQRIIEIPSAIDSTRIKVKLKEGVLSIRMPKIDERRGRRDKIKIEIEKD